MLSNSTWSYKHNDNNILELVHHLNEQNLSWQPPRDAISSTQKHQRDAEKTFVLPSMQAFQLNKELQAQW
jgi:hypothetical protein